MEKEFNLRKEREKLFEEELLGKGTSAGRIYRKIRQGDKEFIKRLLTPNNISKGFVEVSTIKYYAGKS